MSTTLQTALQELNVPLFIQRADHATLARMIAALPTEDTYQPTPEKLPRYGFLYEKQGLRAFKHYVTNQHEGQKGELCEYFLLAFTCWRALVSLSVQKQGNDPGHLSGSGLHLMEAEFGQELILPELMLAFSLSVAGLLSERTAETRLELRQYQLDLSTGQQDWRKVVAAHVLSAFIRLVRKDNGWDDIHHALASLDTLKQMQGKDEELYLDGLAEEQQAPAAFELMGFYHLAQLVVLAGNYLLSGQMGRDKINLRLDRHHEQALDAFEQGQMNFLAHIADLLWVGCRELVQNAIWTHVGLLGENVQKYVEALTSAARNQPVIELWPSQQEALRRHLLDSYHRAILVEMPTSAGKTLLAKFAVIQTKALNPHGTIAYVVPTRALVNQVALDFRADFRHLLRVEQTVPVFELDPTEEHLLKSRIDVLVTTPEKLDLLIRSGHPVTQNLSLVVADEAHNISEEGRGVRLELLLSTIKRDRARARFLLLSPFLPNDEELVQWLGEEQALPPISIHWKPGRKLIGAVKSVKTEGNWTVEFETVSTAHAPDVRAGMKVLIGRTASRITTVHEMTKATVQALLPRGSVLVLCYGPVFAARRAKEIANEMPKLEPHAFRDAVCHYLEAELGTDSHLSAYLQHGVAYHHSGLSLEARWLIEKLIRDGLVKVVCGTTTLAQGMNFPITTVIIEDLRKGRSSHLSYQDFWNIAGRAGRTLVDSVGVVAFPAVDKNRLEGYVDFLKNEAQEISSRLAMLLVRAEEISTTFTVESLYEYPQLSPLLQFLAHAMRVSGNGNLAEEVEDLLRSSLVYYQVQKQSKVAAQKLVQICRSYLEQLSQHKNILVLADQTGFATPTVLELLARKNHNEELTLAENWEPERLFGEDSHPMVERISAIANLPEIQLGKESDYAHSAEQIAAILRDWVNGVSLKQMARRYGAHENDPDVQIMNFSRYLFSRLLSQAAWGIGALETVCLSSQKQRGWQPVGYIPSMLFFGVRQREAIWLRMVGVPRIVANPMAQIWRQQMKGEPRSYEVIREWVSRLSDEEWRQIIPVGSPLTPRDMRLIWQEFSGETLS
ncbi:DEAD/DEAH box helicase [Tengunoibacter tsumagoiensis]|uniref:DEAD/DEAH box helicase n=1 Tax=Tengunoibacter tsumagoiensis TaxID=2014871 RepID=A0A401ZYU3_9CHLR|nr:DEAD/DEAH box helicase [Tengunoibacter tsumagoiensis]GCE12038.1 hypothetical protein KTT_18970 [Tengunoibacter tsumagoiensis]